MHVGSSLHAVLLPMLPWLLEELHPEAVSEQKVDAMISAQPCSYHAVGQGRKSFEAGTLSRESLCVNRACTPNLVVAVHAFRIVRSASEALCAHRGALQ